jgi:hypothetical protein
MRSRTLALLVAAALAGCAGTKTETQPEPEPVAEPQERTESGTESEKLLTKAEQERRVWKQQSEVLYRKHLDTARRYRDAFELDLALREVEAALRFRPQSEDALRLRADLRRNMGDRAGETETVLRDAWEARQVRAEERRVTVRRKLAEAQRALEIEDYNRARRAYESVLFILDVARREGDFDREMAEIDAEAKGRLEELRR